MDDHKKISRSPDVVYRNLAVGESAVLLHVTSGAYHGLNDTGSLIWSLIDGERTRDDIVREVRERVPDAPDAVAADVDQFLNALRERDLIED
jgi:succinate dehydrogenase/fumarate reductase flavoprotein subunit